MENNGLERSTSFRPLTAETSLRYTETLMYGHYSSSKFKNSTRGIEDLSTSLIQPKQNFCTKWFRWSNGRSLSRFLQDWTFLTLLGISVAVFSFFIDLIVEKCILAHRTLYKHMDTLPLRYLAWVTWPILLISFSTGFTRLVGPTAIGSGIPEVKTILKGVVLREYLTLRTLIAKVIGLTAALGSALPLGKVGPFVHLASATAKCLSQFFPFFKNKLENESLNVDILTAAAAVGVSCTFAAPIGGVLFSIEATATYFAVRNYWRGFYAAMCGAISFRLLASLTSSEETLTALFKTNLRQNDAYDIVEIISFSAVGLLSGILGALFVFTHKNIVIFFRTQKTISKLLQKTRFLYPILVTLTVFTILFPEGLGQFMAGELTLKEAVNEMFDNKTWSSMEPANEEEMRILERWRGASQNIFITLFLFFALRFLMCALSTTLPVPCGLFIPAFALGATLGRLFGELMAWYFPEGIRFKPILPGAYAIVGAATFSGAVTHTVSPAVIVFELTGHLGHIMPCVLAVMIAVATAHFLQPSVYDAMIQIKKLPYLPSSIDPVLCSAHLVTAEEIMKKEVIFLTQSSTYLDLLEVLTKCVFRSIPILEDKDSKKLVGALNREDLKQTIYKYYTKILNDSDENNNVKNTPIFKTNTVQQTQLVNRRKKSRGSFSVTPVDLNQQATSDGEQMENLLNTSNNIEKWTISKMSVVVDYSDCELDPAPFQIPQKTSLYKVHWLFNLLSLHHAFVTCDGCVVGVLSLNEVRKAIEKEINRITD